MDLFTLPTHLHLIDRLMDLHVQQKRVTVIKNIDASELPVAFPAVAPAVAVSNQESERELVDLKKQLAEAESKLRRAEDQLSESESKRKASEELVSHMATLKAQLTNVEMDYKKQLIDAESTNKQLLDSDTHRKAAEKRVAAVESQVKVLEGQLASFDMKFKESEDLRSKLKVELDEALALSTQINNFQSIQSASELAELKARCNFMEQKIEESESNYSKIISAILIFSTSVRDRRESLEYFRSLFSELESNATSALVTLGTTLISRLDSMQAEVVSLITQKDDLENELSTSSLQRTMISGDLQALATEFETLKGAYQAMEYELATLQQKNGSNGTNEKELSLAKQKITDLASCLAEAIKKNSELEKGAELVIHLTAKVATVQDRNFELETQLRDMNETVNMHKTTAEALRKKLKEIGGSDSRDFMDTFEEVMREEMLTMKSAFENKLKLAKEEAEMSSRRHQQAIQQLLALSPSSSATQLGISNQLTRGGK